MYAYVIIDCLGQPCVQYISRNKELLEEYKEILWHTYKDTTVNTLFLEEFNEEDLIVDVRLRNYIIPRDSNVLEAYEINSNELKRYK